MQNVLWNLGRWPHEKVLQSLGLRGRGESQRSGRIAHVVAEIQRAVASAKLLGHIDSQIDICLGMRDDIRNLSLQTFLVEAERESAAVRESPGEIVLRVG